MTQLGESAFVAPPVGEENVETSMLMYMLVDNLSQPITGIDYKTVLAGDSAAPLHEASGATALSGKTRIVSTTAGEQIDFYIVWAKLEVNKGFLKM